VTVVAEQVPVQVFTKLVGPVMAPVITLEALLELMVKLTRLLAPPVIVAAAAPELIVKEFPVDSVGLAL
jgi:hypothetical protein